ncbi:probable disease resistance protein At4g27220 isoform X2 [Abrus precatorius]|uniref:Probable disease resistance protein At4g27220 isoform X2 n=1 Tax=Abrus precatorius TaxID=3816 RepID=A0A8B8KFY7_ABRPR|nr:probable disease resistance protein At4g27220 isoform X2 [Abrus precatorius]
MADIVLSIVAKVAEYLVEPVIHEGKYFFCVSRVIKDLQNEKEELKSERDSLQDRVEQAKERTDLIEKPVEEWLNNVKKLLDEVEDLEQRMSTTDNCFQGRCPTWKRYCLCKKIVKKIEAMGKFKGKSNIHPFSRRSPLPGIQYESSENFTYFESTKVAYNQLLEAVQDDCINMIGVYGMGGSGKTTLVTEVGNKAEELNLFDKVISITVSQTPNIKNIQGKMADMLNLKLDEETEDGRAQRIWLTLREKRVLIIVDDIWGEFKLKDVGIRLDNECKSRWKILITTRRQEICDLLDCQKRIHLGLLSNDESWTLFQKHANIDNAFSESLMDVPLRLCDECKGLPIAIVILGSSLKGKSKDEWEVALQTLRYSESIEDHEGVRTALSCLKLSYDYLKNKDAELLFLMCSFFPEDSKISKEYLIRCGVGLGREGAFSLASRRSRIQVGINKLLDSCLLMPAEESRHNWHGYSEETVKMHDLVRDAAIWIAKRLNHKSLVNLDKPLSTLAEDYIIRDYFAVFSWCEENKISFQWDAPNLEILLLHIDNLHSLNLSYATFEGIKGLKVFSIIRPYPFFSSSQLLSLPQSTQLLTNLRTLCLNGWQLDDISFISSLTALEVLDLQSCHINELPNKMENLSRLRLLDLTNCFILQKNYNGAIGKCSQLEELYALGCKPEEYLSQSLMDIVTLPKLQRFVINTIKKNNDPDVEEHLNNAGNICPEGVRFLSLDVFNISNLKTSKQNLLQIAEIVCLQHLHGGCKNVIPDMIGVVGAMKNLSSLSLDDCADIECLFDTTTDPVCVDSHALIPKLVGLELLRLENLKEVCQGQPLQVLRLFEKLEKIYIKDCFKLHSIFPWECNLQNLKILDIGHNFACEALFSMSVAESLHQLQELYIHCCYALKHIIASGRDHCLSTSNDIASAPTSSHFRMLMPNMKRLYISHCPKLESIFPIFFIGGLAQLQEIAIVNAPKLKYIFGECDQGNHSSHWYEGQIMLPHLEVLTLENLQNLIGICLENYHAKWPFETTVSNCPKLTPSETTPPVKSCPL